MTLEERGNRLYRTQPGDRFRDDLTGLVREVISVVRGEDIVIEGRYYQQRHALEYCSLHSRGRQNGTPLGHD